MSKAADCIVVGAGIVGCAVARVLAEGGRGVLVLDPAAPGAEASSAAAGMLAPQIEAAEDDPMLPLALAARDAYPALVASLRAAGHAVELGRGGIVLVALNDDRARELQHMAQQQRRLGLHAQWLPREDLTRRQPGIGPEARGGMLAPLDGHVDNVALCAALAAAAQTAGAVFERQRVDALESQHGSVTGVRAGERTLAAPVVVLAAGAWSPHLAGLPRPLPIEPVRGQMAAVPWPEPLPRTVLFGRGAYVVPRGTEALLGSTMEHSGFIKGTTDAGLAHIMRETAALLPALAPLPTRTWSGLRPMTPDHRPILGHDPDLEGLVYATGHGRNGILLGPITGEIVGDLLTRGETRWDLKPYLITRF